MARDPRAYLFDALARSRRIQTILQGRSLDDYLTDEGIREQVQWNLAIIGEALSTLRKTSSAVSARINDLPGSVATRNFLIHVYHAIDDEKVWDITLSHLPYLVQQLESLLRELDQEDD